MEMMPALGAGAAAAGEGAAATGALGALGTGAAEAGLGAGSALMSAAPGIAGAVGSMAPEALGALGGGAGALMPAGMGLLPESALGGAGVSLAAPAADVGLATSLSEPSLLAKLGLDTPKNLVSATNQGIETLAKLKSMNQRSPYVVGPNLHPGTPTAGVKLASAVQRRTTPLEEFALLLRRAGA